MLASPRGEPAFQIVATVSASAKDDKDSFLLEEYRVSQLNQYDLGKNGLKWTK